MAFGFFVRQSLQRRISLLVILGLAVGLGLFGFIGIQALNESNEQVLRERLTMAGLVADHIDSMLHHAVDELENTVRSPGIDLDDGNMEPEQAVLHDAYSELVIFTHNVFLLDTKGQILLTEPYDEKAKGAIFSNQPSISQTLSTGHSTVSDLTQDPVSGQPIVVVAVAVRNRAGQVTGVLGGTFDLLQPTIGGFIQPIRLGKTGYVEIVDSNGLVILRTEPGVPASVFERSDHPERFAALIREGKATTRTCHRCHETESQQPPKARDLMAFAPLSVASWGVAIRQDEGEALAATNQLQFRLVLLGGTFLALSLLLVGFTVRSVVRPIAALTGAARRIASGDLVSPVPQAGPDEIGALARSFDYMRQRLRASLEEIERWNRELESRVEQRSREITSLFEVAKVMASTLELEPLLRAIMAKTMEVLPSADAGYLFLYDEHLERLVVAAAAGMESEVLRQMALRSGEAIPGAVFSRGRVELYPSPQEIAQSMTASTLPESPYLPPRLAALSQAQSAVGAPLPYKERVIGSLFLVNFRPQEPFTEADLPLIQALANQFAVAIENSRLLADAEEARLLREADRIKTQFMSTVSHELRTPLTSIKGYTTSLLREDVDWDEDTRKEFLQVIDERADDLRDLIDNLLDMSRMEAGALKVDKEPVLVSRVAEKAVEVTAARSRRHQFVIDFPSPFPVVEADARHIEQVLHNLVENAVKYSPNGGKVILRGRVDSDHIIVSVQDEGVGIPAQHLSKVFDRFYRVDNELTRHIVGSGLGLSIAKGLVELHGGQMWVESAAGQGSTFFFTLPLGPTHDEGQPTAEPSLGAVADRRE